MIKQVLFLVVMTPILSIRKTRRMFNNIANYSAELVCKNIYLVKSHMHGWDPQFDGDKILREDMEKFGTEELL